MENSLSNSLSTARTRPAFNIDVDSSADEMMLLRQSRLAHDLGIHDPHAKWFTDESSERLAEVTERIDKVYAAYSLARYRWSTERIQKLAARFRQFILIGGGYDTRSLHLPALAASADVRVFEVDRSERMLRKKSILAAKDYTVPKHIRYVEADLLEPGWTDSLLVAGYDPRLPSLVLAEGIAYLLGEAAVGELLMPQHFPLRSGSILLFDFWGEQRVDGLNSRLETGSEFPLFQNFPLPGEPAAVQEALRTAGWGKVTLQSLETIASEYFEKRIRDEFPNGWLVAEARY